MMVVKVVDMYSSDPVICQREKDDKTYHVNCIEEKKCQCSVSDFYRRRRGRGWIHSQEG